MKAFKKYILGLTIIGSLAISATVAEDYFEISKNMEIFNSVYRELNIYYVDETQPGSLMKTGIDAMLKSLDPYTVYYPESRIEDARYLQTGEYGGIGASIELINGAFTIMDPLEGYPAAEAGLESGDVVLSVNGEPLEGKSQEDISKFLKGQAGTSISVNVKKVVTGEIEDVAMDRVEVKIQEVPYSGMLDEKTGYVKLNSFTKTASSNVKKAFKELKAEGMEQLVFDLRGNGGGLLREAVNIVNIWVDKDQEVVSTRGKLEEWNRTHKTLRDAVDNQIPVIVLVDGSSASASEIVSGTLQDLDRAVILGNQTFGKGLVQQTKDISYNAKMKLTVAKYYIPSGRCIQKLDYSNRAEDGRVNEVDADNIRTFFTTNGRPVFDGRGVAPDVEMNDIHEINILQGLMTNYIVFDYANLFANKNPSPENPAEFKLSDAQYQDFKSYVIERAPEYNTETEALYKQLKSKAQQEKYYEGASAAFEKLEAAIAPSTSKDLDRFKDDIVRQLEGEIISRYHYQIGRIEQQLANDPWIDKAIETFATDYRQILEGSN